MKECQHCKNCYDDEIDTCPDDGMPTMHTINGEPILEGKYHLNSRVGQGGMGIVYKARHAYLKTLHAIKIILPDLVGNDPELVKRFRQEALAAAAIRHQNVVQVTDYGVAQGTMPFLVMEFVEGEDLSDYLAREGKLSAQQSFELVSAICKGISVAHKQGIVHRDMKPLNIMLLDGKTDMSEAVKILDFGLAKIKSGELLGSFIQAQTTGLMGSPYYMAPEQWSDDDLDARSDIYSIGVMLYQMLAGDVPFKGSSIPAIMKKHLTDPPPSFAEKGAEVHSAIEKAVFHTLEKDRKDRTQTVEDLIEELGSAVNSISGNDVTIGFSSSTALPVAPLRVLTNPPKSQVFVNNQSVGESKDDGWLLLEGVQTGNHHIIVKKDGFQDWEGNITCDGKPREIIARLVEDRKSSDSIPMPSQNTLNLSHSAVNAETNSANLQNTPQNFSATQDSGDKTQVLSPEQSQAGQQSVYSETTPKSPFLSPLILALIGIVGLFSLIAIGGVGVYMSGVFESGPTTDKTPTPTETASNPPETPVAVKAEMVEIPGGSFKMGRNSGELFEKPENTISVKGFFMDKTEVTNSEYLNFVSQTNYAPPLDWVNKKPSSGSEKKPVRFVNIEDINAFIKWRSKRDGVEYRLPTEEEWEYAARNGSENNLYPWGNKWNSDKAVISKTLDFADVGSRPEGKNKWGVLDLVGNVWEWTSSTEAASL